MAIQEYQKALDVCQAVQEGRITNLNQLDSVWPSPHLDSFLEKVYNAIIEYWAEIGANDGRIDKTGSFYLIFMVAYHILAAQLDSALSMKLYDLMLGDYDSEIKTEEDIKPLLDKLLKTEHEDRNEIK